MDVDKVGANFLEAIHSKTMALEVEEATAALTSTVVLLETGGITTTAIAIAAFIVLTSACMRGSLDRSLVLAALTSATEGVA